MKRFMVSAPHLAPVVFSLPSASPPLHPSLGTMGSNDSPARLLTLMTRDARVSEDFAQKVIAHYGLESVADLAGIWAEADYTTATSLLMTQLECEHAVQLSRLRNAWRLACSELQQALARKAGDLQEDELDAPLEAETARLQMDEFLAIHHLQWDSEWSPSSILYGRLYRELRKKTLTVFDLKKVRTASQAALILPKKKRKLGTNMSITFEDDDVSQDSSFDSVLGVLRALRILMNGMAMTGTFVMDSKLVSGTKVRCCDLSECTAYVDWVHLKAMQHPGPTSTTIAWLLDRDALTRSRARGLFIEHNWPFGEALREARERVVSVQWAIAGLDMNSPLRPLTSSQPIVHEHAAFDSAPAPARRPPAPASSSSHKGAGKAKQSTPAASGVCPDFQLNKCVPRQRNCPHSAKHACAVCGKWQHGAMSCPQRSGKGARKGGTSK